MNKVLNLLSGVTAEKLTAHRVPKVNDGIYYYDIENGKVVNYGYLNEQINATGVDIDVTDIYNFSSKGRVESVEPLDLYYVPKSGGKKSKKSRKQKRKNRRTRKH